MTYRELIRTYSHGVADGWSDTDLSPRQRRLTHVLLNLASNANAAGCDYPPTTAEREATIKHLGLILWDARPLVVAALNQRAIPDDMDIATERAIEAIRNI